MKKKIICFILVLVCALCSLCLVACKNNNNNNPPSQYDPVGPDREDW